MTAAEEVQAKGKMEQNYGQRQFDKNESQTLVDTNNNLESYDKVETKMSGNLQENIKSTVIDIKGVDIKGVGNANGKAVEGVKSAFIKIDTPSSRAQDITKCCNSVKKTCENIYVKMLFSSSVVAASALIWYFFGYIVTVAFLITVTTVFLVGKYHRWIYVAIRTFPRDLLAISRFIICKYYIYKYSRNDLPLFKIFEENVKKHPDKICFICDDKKWTFAQVDEFSNRVANVFKLHGYKKGDCVAVFMQNKPQFVATWLGLAKIGVVAPLVNTNLRLAPLVHSFTVGKSQAIIFGSEMSDAMQEIASQLDSKIALYQLSTDDDKTTANINERNLNALMSEAATTTPEIKETLGFNDVLLYIYTSGTTGLPKAAIITNSRYIYIATAIKFLAWFTHDDIFYNPLPLYHTAGGVMNIGQALLYGSTIVIKKKFSASSYFSDVKKYDCTVAQYIGEMCRYILAVPEKPEDKQHKLKKIVGNGLRMQIWKEFADRFNIKQICEFYGATEGNTNILNIDNTVGAVGFMSRILPRAYPISIIRVDEDGTPIRGNDSLCIVCKPNEAGVFIGKIFENDPTRAFHGYVDKSASEKKIVRDVFQKGDSAFLSGDLVTADEFGYIFFKDRTGDTFRWKGENVSTSEVEAIVSNIVNYKDAIVYGVEVPNLEGRAGMVSILDEQGDLSLSDLAAGVRKHLPVYARPIFVRILKELELTGTFKLRKVDLQSEGFNPNVVKDSLYILNSSGEYDALTTAVYDDILNGKVRL